MKHRDHEFVITPTGQLLLPAAYSYFKEETSVTTAESISIGEGLQTPSLPGSKMAGSETLADREDHCMEIAFRVFQNLIQRRKCRIGVLVLS